VSFSNESEQRPDCRTLLQAGDYIAVDGRDDHGISAGAHIDAIAARRVMNEVTVHVEGGTARIEIQHDGGEAIAPGLPG
jgi:hypothetical protein